MSFKLKFTLYFPYILLLSALALGTHQINIICLLEF
jgi:hypothetical protein